MAMLKMMIKVYNSQKFRVHDDDIVFLKMHGENVVKILFHTSGHNERIFMIWLIYIRINLSKICSQYMDRPSSLNIREVKTIQKNIY